MTPLEGLEVELKSLRPGRSVAGSSIDRIWHAVQMLHEHLARLNRAAAKTQTEIADITRERDRAVATSELYQRKLELRQTGDLDPGQEVEFKGPLRNGGFTVEELEEVCFRLRVAGCAGHTHVGLNYGHGLFARIPTDSELQPSKWELEERAAAEAVRRRDRRFRAVVVGVPSLLIGPPVLLAVAVALKFVVGFLWGALW